MKLQISAEGMDLSDSVRTLIEEKLGDDIDKYLKDFQEDLKIADVNIVYSPKLGFKADFNMALPGHEHFYAKANSLDPQEELEHVIVRLREELESQLVRYKEKLNREKI